MVPTLLRRLRPDEIELHRELRLAALKDAPKSFAGTFEEASSRPIDAVVSWARARGSHHVRLWVPADRPAALGLYASAGFQRSGTERPFPNRPGISLIEMRLDLHAAASSAPSSPELTLRTPVGLTWRPADSSDLDWLEALRIQTMGPHLEAAGSSVTTQEHRARVVQGFDHIRVIEQGAIRVGMLKLLDESSSWRIVQFQLLPEFQRQGFGGAILGAVIEAAGQQRVPIRLSVLKGNPALRLYARLGFKVVGERERAYDMWLEPQ